MEWLLILLVGGLAAGLGVWASRPGEKGAGEKEVTGGPGSSPPLPATRDDRGKAVTLGEKAQQLKADLQGMLDEAPRKIPAKAIPAKDESARRHSKTPLKVTHSTDQIIGRASRFAHHRRALQNAELLVSKQKAQEAMEVYERAAHRIADPEIQNKINTNVEDIKRWLAGFDLEDDDLRFPEIIIPLTLQNLALENLSQGIKTLSDSLVGKIGETVAAVTAMQMQNYAGAPIAFTPGSSSSGPGTMVQIPGGAGGGGAGGGGSAGAGGGSGGGGGSPGGAAGTGASPSASGSPVALQGGASPGFAQAFSEMGGAVLPVIPRFYPPSGEWTPETGLLKKPGESPDLPPGMKLDDNGELVTDGWTDSDFDREWEKYKNLPAQDRRSGIERRKGLERRTGADAKRKDRRGGEDRRKKDLFKEREEFLKKLEEHKKRKKELEDHRKKKPELPPVEMPLEAGRKPAPVAAADDEGKPKKDATIEIENATITIGDKPSGDKEDGDKPKPDKVLFETAPLDLPPINMPGVGEYQGGSLDPARDLSDRPILNLGLPEGIPVDQAIGAAPAESPQKEETRADTNTGDGDQELPDMPPLDDEPKEEKPQVQEIRGVLELKPPEEDDAPFLTLTYDFTKIPDSFKLSRDYHTMEYAYYKYKPMLVKAQEFTRRKMLKNALNYYRVIKSQNIPPEFKRMINRNIRDITEYMEKFLMSRA